jgi:hypothetical protein
MSVAAPPITAPVHDILALFRTMTINTTHAKNVDETNCT